MLLSCPWKASETEGTELLALMGAPVIHNNVSLVFLALTMRDLCGEDQGETRQVIIRFQVWCVTVRDARRYVRGVKARKRSRQRAKGAGRHPPPSTTSSRHTKTQERSSRMAATPLIAVSNTYLQENVALTAQWTVTGLINVIFVQCAGLTANPP